MKLGLSYNLFDGEELLRSSILSVRESCDHINVVYQKISNFGNKCSEDLEDLLSDLLKEKLIDQLYCYEPNLKIPAIKNELAKRNLGLKISRKNKCSHFLAMDSDEFYVKEQFRKAKDFISQNKIDISACRFVNHIKESIYQIEELSFYYVPFISKIKFFSNFRTNNRFPVIVDPCRKLKGKNFKCFDPEELLMYHMGLVRKDLQKKFYNSSAKDTFLKSGIFEKLRDYKYPDAWIDPTIHYVDPNANNIFRVKEVPNYFNIKI